MGYRAHVCTKYEIEYAEVDNADEFYDLLLKIHKLDCDAFCYYQGEFLEYTTDCELYRDVLEKIKDNPVFTDREKETINDLLTLSDQRNDYIHVDLF